MRKYYRTIGLVFLLMSVHDGSAQERHKPDATPPYSVSVKIERKPRGEYILRVILHYYGKRTLKINEPSLPWANYYSMTICAVEPAPVCAELPTDLIVADPDLRPMQISPGATLTGSISLSERFHDLTKSLKKDDVNIFWSYRLKDISGSSLGTVGGWVLISKMGQ